MRVFHRGVHRRVHSEPRVSHAEEGEAEAQKRASAKYQREQTKRKALTLYKSESDILRWLES